MPELNRRRHRLTTIAALVGAVFAVGSIAAPAYAAPIDATEPGSLTVHKYEKQDTASDLPNNGTEVTVPGYQPLEGVEFTIQQVEGIDLSANAGWADANALTADFTTAAPRYAEQAVAAITGQGAHPGRRHGGHHRCVWGGVLRRPRPRSLPGDRDVVSGGRDALRAVPRDRAAHQP